MKKIFLYFLCAGITITYFACKQSNTNSDQDLSAFNKDSLAQHIKMLASDSFQGRKPFSAGETKAVEYIQKEPS